MLCLKLETKDSDNVELGDSHGNLSFHLQRICTCISLDSVATCFVDPKCRFGLCRPEQKELQGARLAACYSLVVISLLLGREVRKDETRTPRKCRECKLSLVFAS